MPTANKLYGLIGTLTGLSYIALAIVGADGIALVIPVLVASAAFASVGMLTRR